MIPIIGRRARKQRINALVNEVARHERQMRNAVAQLIELTEHGDDLHVECCRLLEALSE